MTGGTGGKVELYADFEYAKLLPFLRQSSHYRLETALKLCEDVRPLSPSSLLLSPSPPSFPPFPLPPSIHPSIHVSVPFARPPSPDSNPVHQMRGGCLVL